MGLCKCPRRQVTPLFCYEHRLNVCPHCLVERHPQVRWSLSENLLTTAALLQCVVKSYKEWLQDSDYDPTCALCRHPLTEANADEVIRLECLRALSRFFDVEDLFSLCRCLSLCLHVQLGCSAPSEHGTGRLPVPHLPRTRHSEREQRRSDRRGLQEKADQVQLGASGTRLALCEHPFADHVMGAVARRCPNSTRWHHLHRRSPSSPNHLPTHTKMALQTSTSRTRTARARQV